jgi:hypothetical protein
VKALNVSLFGQTAKQWRDANPKLDGDLGLLDSLEYQFVHYLVLKLPGADDRLPAASRLNTWKKYCCLRARPAMVTE